MEEVPEEVAVCLVDGRTESKAVAAGSVLRGDAGAPVRANLKPATSLKVNTGCLPSAGASPEGEAAPSVSYFSSVSSVSLDHLPTSLHKRDYLLMCAESGKQLALPS